MTREGRFEGEGLGLLLGAGFDVLDLPDLGRVIRAAGSQLLYVWGEEDPGDVLLMRVEMCYGKELGSVEGLNQMPHKYVALFAQWRMPRLATDSFTLQISDQCFGKLMNKRRGDDGTSRLDSRTALLAAHSSEPSLATVTLETDTSSSGISSWAQLFSARSQMRTLPALSQLMISP